MCVKEKDSVIISLGFEKKFDSARVNENVTATSPQRHFHSNFCCGSKYTETKKNLKRPFIAAGGNGTTLEKMKKDQHAAEKLADPEDRSCAEPIYLHELAALSSEL